jgi:hypothetical protein
MDDTLTKVTFHSLSNKLSPIHWIELEYGRGGGGNANLVSQHKFQNPYHCYQLKLSLNCNRPIGLLQSKIDRFSYFTVFVIDVLTPQS